MPRGGRAPVFRVDSAAGGRGESKPASVPWRRGGRAKPRSWVRARPNDPRSQDMGPAPAEYDSEGRLGQRPRCKLRDTGNRPARRRGSGKGTVGTLRDPTSETPPYARIWSTRRRAPGAVRSRWGGCSSGRRDGPGAINPHACGSFGVSSTRENPDFYRAIALVPLYGAGNRSPGRCAHPEDRVEPFA